MLEELKKRNEQLIQKFQDENDVKKLCRQNLIKNLFKDVNCFFKLDIKDAYNILRDLGFPIEQIETIYKELISFEEFKSYKDNSKITN